MTIFLLVLFGYIGALLYFNSKVRLGTNKRQELQIKSKALKSLISTFNVGFILFVALLVALLSYMVINLDELFPR